MIISETWVKKFLLDTCAGMNRAICEYAKEHYIRSIGSTAAILMFDKKDIYFCNIGDSRIYQFSGKKLTQISHDHSDSIVTDRKPPLTQSLGIPESEFVIAPYVARGLYEDGDQYLICSDGLTDMIPEETISEVISGSVTVLRSAEVLLQRALESGGNDNITIVLCTVRKQRRRFSISQSMQNMR